MNFFELFFQDALSGDNGMVLKNKAAHHAIVKSLDSAFSFDRDLVVQYEVGFQSGIECGGAYMKLGMRKNAFYVGNVNVNAKI